MQHSDGNNLCGLSLTKHLLYTDKEFGQYIFLETIRATKDDAENGCFVEVDVKYTDNRQKEKTYFSNLSKV